MLGVLASRAPKAARKPRTYFAPAGDAKPCWMEARIPDPNDRVHKEAEALST